MGAKRPRVWQSTCSPCDPGALDERYCLASGLLSIVYVREELRYSASIALHGGGYWGLSGGLPWGHKVGPA